LSQKPPALSRLYAIEGAASVTGAYADHRLALRSSAVGPFARALAVKLGVSAALTGAGSLDATASRWVDVLAADLKRAGAAGLVIAGASQPPLVHALAHAVNDALGGVGRTVAYIPPPEADPVNHADSLAALVDDMRRGSVETLLIVGGNPVYSAPADLEFAQALQRVGFRLHLSLYDDETSSLCHWHVPATHFLESWSDVRAYDGTASIVQPLIAPLYDGRSAHELLAALLDSPQRTAHEVVREHWKKSLGGSDFETAWQVAVHDGVVPGSAFSPRDVSLSRDFLSSIPAAAAAAETAGPGAAELEITFRLDPTVGDGRYANNAWLQELPKPLSKLTWDNAAMIAPGPPRSVSAWRPGTWWRSPAAIAAWRCRCCCCRDSRASR
jgi:molybdopterin-containing oxidoreductase family iron-sulfur binding subunit